ncbi:MAG TPA: phosphoribosylamine--glycine ligase [Gemmatimonadaceae bacterium]|nr:phosphoribosylamine--glycine ligase [Gemmatimonadaceae bacterium]
MRVLIVGGGGREHALAWKFKRDDSSVEIIAAPGNPGIAELGECVPIPATDVESLVRLARDRAVDLTVVGPEAPLAAGIVDRFRADGLAIFGPTRAAAEIETSKAFAKRLMLEDGIPTARAEVHSDVSSARACAHRYGAPVVIKASGLAAGKGVIICRTLDDADRAIEDILAGNRFGDAGAEVLVEEFMEGEELSVFAITDGTSFVLLPGLQDHKRLHDKDMGPNTGGMGAYVPVTLPHTDHSVSRSTDPSDSLYAEIAERVVRPTLRGLARRGRPFTGLLYAGLMLTRDGPKVVEFNCRFGDPETQALMPVLDLEPPLLELMRMAAGDHALEGSVASDLARSASAAGSGANGFDVRVSLSGACVTTVLAAEHYPEKPRTGDPIELPPIVDDGVVVFHAGTVRDASGRLVTAGGRVLAVSAVASDIQTAQQHSLDFARRIRFPGCQLRTDIAWREIARRREPAGRGDG